MKFCFLVLSVFLTGCAEPGAQLELTLNSYAAALEHPVSESAALKDLSGEALRASKDSQKLLSDLGLRQKGAAQFTILEVSSSSAIACLDVSRTYFEDIWGNKANLQDRADRLLIRVRFAQLSSRQIITDFSLLGESC
jgi:hypothetical protein